MIRRKFWIERIENAWRKAPVVWLTGVRRVGKTTLAKHWSDAVFLNCDLPRNRELLRDPELFFEQVKEPVVILDEVHQTENPSEILKVAADEFPRLRILATGSSTLAATRKFRDSLTGRKRVVHLCPVLATEMEAFGIKSLRDRLQRGGLPDRLLDPGSDPEFYQEWLDSYFARDVQELFNIGKRTEFLKLCELLLRQSGQLAEVVSLAKHSGLSRPTVNNYLQVFETTHLIRILKPFHNGGRREILAQPKIYGFDTGFVCHFRGWEELRTDDCGELFEHLVLDLLSAHSPSTQIYFWRDKQKREIDFILKEAGGGTTTIECKWSRRHASAENLNAYRRFYPKGKNIVVTAEPGMDQLVHLGNHKVRFCAINKLDSLLRG